MFGRGTADIGLVILDMTMPRMSGRDAFRAMAGIDPGRPGCCSRAGTRRRTCPSWTARPGLLSKPYRPAEMLAAVREALGRGDAVAAAG